LGIRLLGGYPNRQHQAQHGENVPVWPELSSVRLLKLNHGIGSGKADGTTTIRLRNAWLVERPMGAATGFIQPVAAAPACTSNVGC
jgi:hypothetical protein